MNNTKKIDERYFVLAILALVLLLILSRKYFAHELPSIYNDEFGYWASAAYLSGHDWSDVISSISYYSGGYGIILAVLFSIFKEPSKIYLSAILLNYVWCTASLVILTYFLKRIKNELSWMCCGMMAFIAVLIPANIVQVNYTWPETFMFFLFCSIAYVALLVIEKATYLNVLTFSCLLVLNYFVHQRTVGIIIASIVLVMLLLLSRKMSFTQVVVFVLVIIVGIIIAILFKEYIKGNIWNNSITTESNSIGGQVGKLSFMLSLEGVLYLIGSLGGKCFYLIVSTCSIIGIFICASIEKIISYKKNVNDALIYFYCLLCCLGTIGISSIAMIIPVSDTQLLYGRYTENIIGPLIALGLIRILDDKINIKMILSIGVGIILTGGLTLIAKELAQSAGITIINSVGIVNYINSNTVDVWKASIVTISMILIIAILRAMKGIDLSVVVILIIICGSWISTGDNAYRLWERTGWENAHKSNIKIYEIINEYSNNVDVPIYAISVKGYNYPEEYSGNGIQFLLYNQPINYITSDDIENILDKEPCLIIAPVEIKQRITGDVLHRTEEYYLITNSNFPH